MSHKLDRVLDATALAAAVAAALAAALAGATPASGELPRAGRVDTTLCWGGPAHVIVATPTDRFGSYVVKGGTSASDMTFDSMTMECTGTFETRSAGAGSRGYCVFEDASGDRIYGTDAMTPDGRYAWEYLGGTGKFKGISGRGSVERVGTLAPEPGRLRGCRRFVGTYQLP